MIDAVTGAFIGLGAGSLWFVRLVFEYVFSCVLCEYMVRVVVGGCVDVMPDAAHPIHLPPLLLRATGAGIIALLDEACLFPAGTHETFAQKLYQTHQKHARFAKPKMSNTAFTLNHYAGSVTYSSEAFLEKNKDYVVLEHQMLFADSESDFLKVLFKDSIEAVRETKSAMKFSSVRTP